MKLVKNVQVRSRNLPVVKNSMQKPDLLHKRNQTRHQIFLNALLTRSPCRWEQGLMGHSGEPDMSE